MQLQLGEIEDHIKAKGYNDYIANKIGMIELYDDKLTIADTDIALENLFINTGINKDTTLDDAIDISIVAEHLLKKKETGVSSSVSSCNINRLTGVSSQKIETTVSSSVSSCNISKLDGVSSKRVKTYNLRFYDLEIDLIETQAKELGLPPTTLLRQVIRQNFIKI